MEIDYLITFLKDKNVHVIKKKNTLIYLITG